MQGYVGHHHTIFIGIQPFTCPNDASLDDQAHITHPLSSPGSRHGNECKRADAERHSAQFSHVSDSAIDEDARPAIACGRSGNVAADQCTAECSCPVNHKHSALTCLLFENLFDQGVVFMTTNRHDLPRKNGASTIVLKNGRHDAKCTAVVIFVCVAKIRGGERNAHERPQVENWIGKAREYTSQNLQSPYVRLHSQWAFGNAHQRKAEATNPQQSGQKNDFSAWKA